MGEYDLGVPDVVGWVAVFVVLTTGVALAVGAFVFDEVPESVFRLESCFKVFDESAVIFCNIKSLTIVEWSCVAAIVAAIATFSCATE